MKKFHPAASILGVFAVLIAVQSPMWIFLERVSVHDTLRNFPIWAYFADCIRHGWLPLWDPYMETGHPAYLISPGMIQAWNPWTLALMFLGKYFKVPFIDLYHYDWLIRYLVFSTGCYFLLNRLCKDKKAAFIGFASITLSSLSLSYLWQSSYLIALWSTPWLMYYIVLLLETSNPVFFLPLALSAGLASQSYHVLYPVTFLLFWLPFALWKTRPEWKQLASPYFLGGGLLFLMLVLKIAAEALALRDITPILRSEVDRFSAANIWDYYMMAAPYYEPHYVYHSGIDSETRIYMGFIPLALFLFGIWKSQHRYKWAFLAAGFLSALLSLGIKMSWVIPTLRIIRNVADFHVFFMLCAAFFICEGAAALFNRKWHKFLPGALIVLTLIDLGVYNWWALPMHAPPKKDVPAPLLSRSLPDFHFWEKKVPVIYDYHFYNSPGAAHIASAYHQEGRWGSHYVEKKDFHEFMRLGNREAMDAAAGISEPVLRVVSNASVMPREKIIEAMKKGEKTVFLEESLDVPLSGDSNAGQARMTLFEANRCRIEAQCGGNCLLYYSDGFDRAWRAYVDGKPTKIYRANLAFKAVPLTAGTHEIVFEYNPTFFKWSLWLYFAATAGGLLWIFKIFLKNR